MKRGLKNWGCDRATAAAEMALVLPLMIALLFGGFEGGNYMWNEHKVIKGVRDGARYAGRQGFGAFDCTDGTIVATVEANIQAMTRLGAPDPQSQNSPRVPGWNATDVDGVDTVTVTVDCDESTASGIYRDLGEAPRVTVAARVAYPSLFQTLGFDTTDAVVRAEAEAVVAGI
ncbi:TadE/TadG family type IV pilus assembly protein [Altererythrobacter sp. CAU 1778]